MITIQKWSLLILEMNNKKEGEEERDIMTKYDFQMVIKAINYATEKHDGQKRLDGKPYITHPLAVAEQVEGIPERIVAVLHDVLEDTDTTVQDLYREFGAEIALAVMFLTKDENEEYENYITRLKLAKNPLSTAVKIADLRHNLFTIENIPDLDKRKRLKDRYIRALQVLE